MIAPVKSAILAPADIGIPSQPVRSAVRGSP